MNFSALLFLVVVSHLWITGSSIPTKKQASKQRFQDVTNDNRLFRIGGKDIDLYRDWMVNLTDTHGSINITKKAFQVDFNCVPKNDSILFLILEAHTNATEYTVEVPVFKNTKTLLVIPQVYFPTKALSQGTRLVVHIQTPTSIAQIIVVDAPCHSEIKDQEFAFRYWKLHRAVTNQNDWTNELIMDLRKYNQSAHSLNLFQDVYDVVMKSVAQKRLKNRLHVVTTLPDLDAINTFDGNTTMFDRSNCNARFMTAVSREIVSSSSGLYSKTPRSIHRLLQVVPHSNTTTNYLRSLFNFRFVGRIIGIAIANQLQFDASISPDILKAILHKPDVDSFKLYFKGVFLGPEAQVAAEMDSLRQGVWDSVPRELLEPFTEAELSHIISGRTDLCINDLRKWVQYEGYINEDTELIGWFWKYVENLEQHDLLMLWEIITGSPRLPPTDLLGDKHKFAIRTYIRKVNGGLPVCELLPIGVHRTHDPALLYIPHYKSQAVFNKNFNQAIGIRSKLAGRVRQIVKVPSSTAQGQHKSC